MYTIKFDNSLGGFVILELKVYRTFGNFVSATAWFISYSFGDTSAIQFYLNEIRSKSESMIFSKSRCFSSIKELVPLIKNNIESALIHAREQKVSERFMIQKIKEELKEEEANCKKELALADKRLRSWKNIDLIRDLEKRGLITPEE